MSVNRPGVDTHAHRLPDNRDNIPGMSGQLSGSRPIPFEKQRENDFPHVGLTARLAAEPSATG